MAAGVGKQLELGAMAAPKRRGRPPGKGKKRGVPHRARPHHERGEPVHVTMRVVRELPSLREWRVAEAIELAIGKGHKEGFRVIHYSIQPDHLHLVVEAEGRRTLMRGIQGLAIRMAKYVNARLGREGRVFQERYHARALGSPLEVRRCLAYVLLNFRKHVQRAVGADPLSSGRWFDGWSTAVRVGEADRPREDARPPVRRALTWLATKGWRRHGLVSPNERPATAEVRPSR
jgi:REP-associated tyrosine transposase